MTQTVTQRILGPVDKFPFDARALHMGIVIFFCALFVSIICNYLVDYNSEYTHWLVSILAFTALAYWGSRVKSWINFGRILFIACVLGALSVSWFMFAGPEGATPYYMIPATILVWFVSKKWAIRIMLALVCSYIALVVLDRHFPEWTVAYADANAMFWDKTIAQVLVFVMFIFSNWFIRQQFEQTVAKNNFQYREISEQKDQLEHMKKALEKNQLALEKRNEELMTANDQKTRLFSIISHDLRSPLSGIQNSMRLLKMDVLTKEESEKIFSLLDQDVTLTIGMLENLLTWSNMQIQGCNIQLQSLNVKTTIHGTLQLIESYASNKNIQIKCKIDDALKVKADSESLKLIVRNLAMNAVKFSHADSVVEVLGTHEVEYTEIQICDKGQGMSPDQIKNLFSGETVSSLGTENEYGTGLGLKLCKVYIDEHDGDIHCESIEGQGTVFRVRFPN